MYPLLRFGDSFQMPTYFVAMAAAYCVAVFYLYTRTQHKNLDTRVAMDISLVIMISGFLGSRLFHVFYEAPDFYWQFPFETLKFWQGGFVFYGGFGVSLLTTLIYLKIKREEPSVWADTLAPVICLGYILGRFGTLLSGSGYGSPSELPWAITYPPGSEAPSGIPLHPTPIYAMLLEGLTLAVLLFLERHRKQLSLVPGQLFAFFLMGHGIGRLIVEQFRDDARGAFVLSFSVSSWLSVLIVSVGLILFWHLGRLKPKPRTQR